jgi:hypothetical protein
MEVKLLGQHEEESSQKITALEALCKMLREDAQKLREEKTTLEGMVESRDELIMEMAKEYGLNCMGENNDDEDDDDEGDAAAPPATDVPPPTPAPPTDVPEEIVKQEAPVDMVPEQEAPVVHEVILTYAEPEQPQPRLFNMIMRDYEDTPPRMMNGPHELDDLDDLDDLTEADYDMDEWFPEEGSNDQD